VRFDALLHQGRRLPTPSRRPVVEIESTGPLEDMPWDHGLHVISERLRDFLRHEAARQAQYFRVTLRGPKKVPSSQAYYLVNWLRVIDCIDLERSEIAGTPGQLNFVPIRIKLRMDRVPDGVLVYRLKHMESTTLIDLRLATKITARGFTGPQFYTRLGLRA
jgi:hypothetical protein